MTGTLPGSRVSSQAAVPVAPATTTAAAVSTHHLVYQREPLPIGLYVGCFRRFLYQHGGFELQAQVETESVHRYDLVLRW